MSDKLLSCRECGKHFDFTDEEQDFFKKMKFCEPKRCPPCRKAKRENKKQECGESA
jgi:hypothetical protein